LNEIDLLVTDSDLPAGDRKQMYDSGLKEILQTS
jgi:hypothetical protein